MAADPGDPLVGRLLDRRYLLGERIARGGMASVYSAVDTRLDRPVAVKIMHPGLGDDDEFAARFVREARAAAKVIHPHVVGVFDQGEDEGTIFLAMEYVPGHTMREAIRNESPMPPRRALALLEPVVMALAAAHRTGLIHRDVKPENVLIDEEGHIKVADFGLAKAVSAETSHTATGGVLIGTVAYLAPEVIVHGKADARADVYALGVLLYELLTGSKPHTGETPIQVAYKAVHEDVAAPSQAVPGLPTYVDALVARATARDESQRPADAGVLLHQLRRVTQALAEGITDDPELVADLMPHKPAPDFAEDFEHDTTPEILDPSEVAAVAAGVGLSDQPTVTVPATPPAGQASPSSKSASKPAGDSASDSAGAAAGDYDWLTDWQPDSATGRLDLAVDAPPAPGLQPHQEQQQPVVFTPTPLPAPELLAPPVAPSPRRRRWKGPLLLLLALLLAVGVGVGAYWFGVARWTLTPGVLQLPQDKAVAELEKAGLSAEIGDPAYSESVPEGRVVSTDPDPGAKVLRGGTVTLVVSAGKERYNIPELAGMSVDAAQDAVLGTNLAWGEASEKYSETIPEGQVISVDPAPGTEVRRDTVVDVVVSKGRKPRRVRDFTGKRAERAVRALERKGLVVDSTEVYDDNVAAGVIISQDPVDAELYKGDTVSITVSKGPELQAVPDVIATGVDAARQALEDAGFVVNVEKSGTYVGLQYVVSSDPDPGTMIPLGSTVTIYLV